MTPELRWILVAAWIAAVAFVLFLWRTHQRRLRRLRRAVEAIASGDAAKRAPIDLPGEAGRIGAAVNRLAEQMDQVRSARASEVSTLEAVLSAMQEPVILTDLEGRLLHANAAAIALFRVRPVPDAFLWDLVRWRELDGLFRRAREQTGPIRQTVEHEGRAFDVMIGRTRTGNELVLVAREVTEERTFEQLRRQFVANVSHELRTPLTLLRGTLETLRSGAWQDPERAADFLEGMRRNVERLSAIVEGLLELSRLESGPGILRRRDVPIAEIVSRAVEPYRELASSKGVELSAGPDPDLVISADPELLTQAVANLVDNAVKYTPGQGKVRVEAFAQESEAVVQVSDTGIGIPEKEIPRIFERFYRVDRSRSRDLGGAGLGLSIAKHIVELHGGRIEVESHPGEGSVFRVCLPR